MARKKSEKELLEDYLVEELNKLNIYNFKGNPIGLKGFPDRVVIGKEIYFIELKLGKENKSYYEQTLMQKKWEQQINQTSSTYNILSNRDDIDKMVKKIHKECVENNIKNYFAFNIDIT